MKRGFTLFKDSLDILDELTDDQAGKLFKAIRNFNCGKEVDLEPTLRMCFLPFKNQFLREGLGLSEQEISDINKKNRNKRKVTKSNESNESNESVHLISSDSIVKGNSKSIVKVEKIPFETIWDLYGYKQSYKTAKKAWSKLTEEQQEKCLVKIPEYVAFIKATEIKQAYLASWLNAHRWNDENVIPIAKKPKYEELRFDEKGEIILTKK